MTIRKLREAVERGEWDHDAAAAWLWTKPGQIYGWAHDAFNGSLDAAKALHDALLPGWLVEGFNLDGEVVLRRNRPINRAYGDALNNGEVARAWLIAILRALEEEGRDG